MTNTVLHKQVSQLQQDLMGCRDRVVLLEKEVDFLRTHTSIAKGMKGETLALSIAHGKLTIKNKSHDLTLHNGMKIEIKYSKLNDPSRSKTRRWSWSKPLGHKDKGKDYNWLLLIGDVDLRYQLQYLSDGPYVFFLIPIEGVPELMASGITIGGTINCSSNLKSMHSGSMGRLIANYQVSEKEISKLETIIGTEL